MLNRLIHTDDGLAQFIARLTIAAAILPHGAQKLFGWFGGSGPAGTMDFFTRWGFHPALVVILIFIESIGILLLAAGFLGRLQAALVAIVMVVAVIKARHYLHFFMNWYMEARRPEGFEYHLLVLGCALIVMILGSGRWSVDRALARRA